MQTNTLQKAIIMTISLWLGTVLCVEERVVPANLRKIITACLGEGYEILRDEKFQKYQ